MFIADLLQNYEIKKDKAPQSIWNEFVGKFTDRINECRKIDMWKAYVVWLKETKQKHTAGTQARFQKLPTFIKPYTYPRIAMKLADGKVTNSDDLHLFYGFCADAPHFSKAFFGALKPRI